jgi:hypothetical protein
VNRDPAGSCVACVSRGVAAVSWRPLGSLGKILQHTRHDFSIVERGADGNASRAPLPTVCNATAVQCGNYGGSALGRCQVYATSLRDYGGTQKQGRFKGAQAGPEFAKSDRNNRMC